MLLENLCYIDVFIIFVIFYLMTKCYYLFIGKIFCIDDYEMTDVLNILNHLLINMVYSVI